MTGRSEWDAFISHASEDKAAVARPLAQRLEAMGVRVWLDEKELTVGQSLRAGIDRGLSHSRYGIVILSPAFFGKTWTQAELGGLFSRETSEAHVILPVWHNITAAEIRAHSPLLADRIAVRWEDGIDSAAAKLLAVIRPSASTPSDHKLSDTLPRELIKRLRSIGPSDPSYNSFAWAAGDTDRWWYPGPLSYWPIHHDEAATMSTFLSFRILGLQDHA